MSDGVWLIMKGFNRDGTDAGVKVESFSLGAPQEPAKPHVTGELHRKVPSNAFTVTKKNDETSAKLIELASSGQKIEKMFIMLATGIGADSKQRIASKFTDVSVTSIQMNDVYEADDAPLEQITFRFAREN